MLSLDTVARICPVHIPHFSAHIERVVLCSRNVATSLFPNGWMKNVFGGTVSTSKSRDTEIFALNNHAEEVGD